MLDEKELVSREQGKKLAEAWAKKPRKLDIPDTLLSSKEIKTVVQATGLIAPFYVGGGRKARLKKASYEGRVGSKAYRYKDINVPERIFDAEKHENLIVPKNSIVFVESDLDFRLPDFIALRFNLQIQHVHRGLLLGTGPLVDPGFWGKLCIPLHNLTDEDYLIPKTEGLFWVEFTKTTLATDDTDDARVALDAGPRDERGNWEIEKFLDKAATQYTGQKVPIRSSLPTIFGKANEAAIKAANDAELARKEAERFGKINIIGIIAAIVGLGSLIFAASNFFGGISARDEQIASDLRTQTLETQEELQRHVIDVDRYGSRASESAASVPAIRGELDRQRREIAELQKRLNDQRRALERLDQQTDRRCLTAFHRGVCWVRVSKPSISVST